MASNSTQLRQLNQMALTDLVLPKEALDNIIECNELENRLSSYATVDNVVVAIEDTERKLSGYVPLSTYETLLSRIDALETQINSLSTYRSDKDVLDGAIQQLCTKIQTATRQFNAALGGTCISVVDTYNSQEALPGTIYFVKSSLNDMLSAVHFIPKINNDTVNTSIVENIDVGNNIIEDDMLENNEQQNEEDSPKMQFINIKSEMSDAGTVKKGERIDLSGSNLLGPNDEQTRYGLSVASFRQPTGMDAMTPAIKTFVDIQSQFNGDEHQNSQIDFTDNQITIPSSIWDTALNTDAVNDGFHDSITIMLQKFKNGVLVDSADITAKIVSGTPMLAVAPKTRKRKNK